MLFISYNLKKMDIYIYIINICGTKGKVVGIVVVLFQ